MNTEDIPIYMREMLAVFNALRILGYKPEHIFAFMTDEGLVGITLRVGEKEFNASTGTVTIPRAEFIDKWTQVCRAVTSGAISQDALDQIYVDSVVRNDAVYFVTSLAEAGFEMYTDDSYAAQQDRATRN